MTIFTDAKDDTTVLELKKMIEGKARSKKKKLHKNVTSYKSFVDIMCSYITSLMWFF